VEEVRRSVSRLSRLLWALHLDLREGFEDDMRVRFGVVNCYVGIK
jgi:hypothetical protein